jgi:translation initiation factor 1
MKKKPNTIGFVYSTDPNFKPEVEQELEEETLLPNQQKLKIRLETKHRAGKAVSLIIGFIGTQLDKEEMVKKLKNHCGTGGSAKDGEMLIQGDQRDKILQWLLKNGYAQSKKI